MGKLNFLAFLEKFKSHSQSNFFHVNKLLIIHKKFSLHLVLILTY